MTINLINKKRILLGLSIMLIASRTMAQQPVFQSDAYTIYPDRVVQGKYTAKAVSATELVSNYQGINKVDSGKVISSSWKLNKNISAFPQYHSNYIIADAIYNMALEEMQNAVEPDSTLRTGKEWGGVWTRDISYSIILSMAVLQPKVAMYSLLRKVQNGRIIQDTGTGGSYPCSSDRMIWAVAAWEVYKVTGDQAWLAKAYRIISKSADEDALNIYDAVTGLVRGESSFLDWREQTYPRWMQPIDIYQSECLGTNAVHYKVNTVLSQMATLLHDNGAAGKFRQRAQRIKAGIQKYLWIPEKGYYGQYIYGRKSNLLSPRSEALGEALAIYFGVADAERAKQIVSHTPVNKFGIPCIYPQIPNIPPYHNNAVWPFVESYWALASAQAGNETSVMRAISSVYRPAALFLTNKENMVNSSGDFAGTQINSSNMLWSLSGNLALVYKVLFGISYAENRMTFKPFVPKALAGKQLLTGFHYRNAVLNVAMIGYGNTIKSILLDGKPLQGAQIPATLGGEHTIEIKLANNNIGGLINVEPDHTTAETPVINKQQNTLNWNKVPGAVGYLIFKNGKLIKRTTDLTLLGNAGILAEYQVAAVDKSGYASFASEPVELLPEQLAVNIQAEDFATKANLPHQGFTGSGFVNLSHKENATLNVPVNINQAGRYWVEVRYANGNGPLSTNNKCAFRSLEVNGQFAGTIVMPQRGENNWSDWGFSNAVTVSFKKGENQIKLELKDSNTNMNGEVNQAVVDYVRIIKIN
jgi:hypothetical protein